jgi:hypothetical protein
VSVPHTLTVLSKDPDSGNLQIGLVFSLASNTLSFDPQEGTEKRTYEERPLHAACVYSTTCSSPLTALPKRCNRRLRFNRCGFLFVDGAAASGQYLVKKVDVTAVRRNERLGRALEGPES